MRNLDDILEEIERDKKVKGTVFGKYANKITAEDVSEWENSSAGIDTNNKGKRLQDERDQISRFE